MWITPIPSALPAGYGNGDIQWMTAGSGCQHAEMFPLIYQNQDNPLEFFQIWLNLAKKDKFTEPYYKMLWAEDILDLLVTDAHGKKAWCDWLPDPIRGHAPRRHRRRHGQTSRNITYESS